MTGDLSTTEAPFVVDDRRRIFATCFTREVDRGDEPLADVGGGGCSYECHYMNGTPSAHSLGKKSIIPCPTGGLQLVALSATWPTPASFTDWIERVHWPHHLVDE